MVRVVICCWQCNYLALLSFTQKSVWGKGIKNQNHNKRGQRVSDQITITSPECWSRAPFYNNHKKPHFFKSIQAFNPRFGYRDTPQAGNVTEASAGRAIQGMFRSAAIQTHHFTNPSENRGEDLNHIQRTLLPCQSLTNIQKLLLFILR